MLRLFRKLRKKMILEKKVRHYLLYALGEIILIVIGILIALGINNWNIREQERDQEQFYLLGLRQEFVLSKIKLEKLIEVNQQNYENSKKIAAFIDAETRPTEKELSVLIFQSLTNEISYNPNNSLLNELINTGGLKVISNPDLRKSLTSWESFIQSIKYQERGLQEQRERLLNVLREEGSIRTGLDETGVTSEMGLKKSSRVGSNLALLESMKFENELLLFILTGSLTETAHYQPLLEEINEILVLLNQEIED